MKIKVKQIIEVVKVVEVEDGVYKDETAFKKNLVEFFDNFPFDQLNGTIIEEDEQIFIGGDTLEDIKFEMEKRL